MLSTFRRFAIIACAFLAFTFAPSGPTRAATIHTDGSGDVTSITGLDVGGSFFDIAFIHGGEGLSYNDAYTPDTPHYANAEAAAGAIVSFLNSFDPLPKISGTIDPEYGYTGFQIPFALAPTYVQVFYANTNCNSSTPRYCTNPMDTFSPTRLNPSVYAWVELYPTPLPATLPLFATGLSGLGLLGWRRKRKAAALAAT